MEENKKVLIFGQGQLGHDLMRVLTPEFFAVCVGRGEVDVSSQDSVFTKINEVKPDIVVNATAYNKVDLAENEKATAFAVNEKAVGYLAEAAKAANAVFIHVSTDYIFDGLKEFYIEDDMPNPLNQYGASKLAGEERVKSLGGKFYLIRTSSVFGVKQSGQKLNFVDRIISMAKEGKPLQVVDDLVSSPTYSLDLALKIKELILKSAPFGIYHITNQGSCSWYEFAQEIVKQAGLKAEISPTKSDPSKAKRPKHSVLKNQALERAKISLLPRWQDALKRYLKESR